MRATVATLLLLAAHASAAALTRGPALQLADATGITVTFRTDVPAVGEVRFGAVPGALSGTVTELVPSTVHAVRLNGLTPSTRYAYEVAIDGVIVASGAAFTFRTYPPPGTPEPFRLFAWGDSGNASERQLKVAERLAGEVGDATLSLILGDIIYDSGEAQFYDDRFFAPYAPLLRRSVIWPTIGNHDVGADPLGGPYLDAFTLPTNNPAATELYYSFDYGDAHFVCLDTHVSSHAAGSPQLLWAAADLASSTARWKFVFFHVPPWSGGSHPDDAAVIAGIVPMAEAAGVDVVFSGHSHAYERTYLLRGGAIAQGDQSSYVKASPDAGTLYVVSGTAGQSDALSNAAHPLMAFQVGNVLGASVIDVSGESLHGYFLRDDGVAVDLFRLRKGSDATPPRLLAARALLPTQVELSFDEPVLAATAELASAYTITPTVAVTAASLGSDARTVRLTTAAHAEGRYSVAAAGVDDGAGNLSSAVLRADYVVAPSLVLTTNSVRYFVANAGTPSGWQARSFDDSSWAQGTQPIGFGESGLGTTVSVHPEVTLYTRAHFTPSVDPAQVRELNLELDYDDGFVAFLNGVEIARQNVPLGQGNTSVASALRESGLLEHRLVGAPLLVAGDNVLAIEVHDISTISTDLLLSARLRAVLAPPVDGGSGDAGQADAGSADAGETDAGAPDAGPPDAGALDAGQPDAGPTDAGMTDAGTTDAGTTDAGTTDAGTTDAGTTDAGTTGAGTADAGQSDAGQADAGENVDAGEVDAGVDRGAVGGGCGCDSSGGGLTLVLWALGLAFSARRRSAAR